MIKDGGSRGRNGKNRGLESNGNVTIMGEESSLYKQRLHPFHFSHSWEASGPSGGCAVLVFNNYRQLIRWLSYTIDGFLFLEPRKERLYSCQAHLFTQPSDNVPGCLVTSHIDAEGCFFQIKDKNW
jgi:hypothetical protein